MINTLQVNISRQPACQGSLHTSPDSLCKSTFCEEVGNRLHPIAAVPRAVCAGSEVTMVQEESDRPSILFSFMIQLRYCGQRHNSDEVLTRYPFISHTFCLRTHIWTQFIDSDDNLWNTAHFCLLKLYLSCYYSAGTVNEEDYQMMKSAEWCLRFFNINLNFDWIHQ